MDHYNATAVTSNFSSPRLPSLPFWDQTRLVPAVIMFLCFSVGVPGNIAVIILKPNWEHLSSLSQSLLLNLAVSDLLCLLSLPLWSYFSLYGWPFSPVVCKLLAYTEYCSIYSSLLTVTGLSVQRYLQVVHRQSGQQIHKPLLLILLWLVAFILSIPSLVVRQVNKDEQWLTCQSNFSSDAQWIAVLTEEAVLGFGSFVTVAVLYILLHKKIHQAAFFNHPQTSRLVTSIVVCFFILWVPYITINVLGVAAISLKNEDLLKFCTNAWNIAQSIVFFNSCLNPLLYAFTSCKFNTICQKEEPAHQPRISQTTNIRTTE